MVEIPSTQILDGLSDGITVQDNAFNIIYQNRVMQETFGRRIDEKCYAVYEKRDKICEGCGVQRAMKTGKAEVVLRTAFETNGNTSYWENACIPLFDDKGNVIAGVEVCRNISSRVTLEEEVKERNILLGQTNKQLERKTEELQNALSQREALAISLKLEMQRREQMELELRQAQKLESVGRLAAGIAHEINTPAQYVSDNVSFLGESFKSMQLLIDKYRQAVETLATTPGHEKLAEEIRMFEKVNDLKYFQENVPEAIKEVSDGMSNISTIVSAMKDFAQPDNQVKVAADMNQALLATLAVTKSEYRNIAEIETIFGELPMVPCHIGYLNQAFLNLIINATHAIREVAKEEGEKGKIRVKTSFDGEKVRIEIEDTGIGIPADIHDRVFDPFFTTKQEGQGRGQGLSVARSIVVNKHGGSLTFTSEPGKGTAFIILLPVGIKV